MNLNITSIPEGLKVGGDLTVEDSNITTLPEGLKIGYSYTPFKFSSLDSRNTNMTGDVSVGVFMNSQI